MHSLLLCIVLLPDEVPLFLSGATTGQTLFVANNELRWMYELLSQQDTECAVTDFCSHLGIEWRFIPEHAQHFGGLWEAAVKSAKTHRYRIVGESLKSCLQFWLKLKRV